MQPRQLVFTLGAIGAIGAGAWYGLSLSDGGTVAVGAPAPDFHAAVIGQPGITRRLADYQGDVLFLNLWATWCGPCVVEMPTIQRLHERFGSSGLRVVAVAVDDPPFADRVAAFVKERGLTFEILHEGSGTIEQDYRSRGIPSTYLVGRDGRLRVIRQGAADWDTEAVHRLVEQLLAVPDPRIAATPPP
jgi:thiol-disulfide isomerase/thioredoxin